MIKLKVHIQRNEQCHGGTTSSKVDAICILRSCGYHARCTRDSRGRFPSISMNVIDILSTLTSVGGIMPIILELKAPQTIKLERV